MAFYDLAKTAIDDSAGNWPSSGGKNARPLVSEQVSFERDVRLVGRFIPGEERSQESQKTIDAAGRAAVRWLVGILPASNFTP